MTNKYCFKFLLLKNIYRKVDFKPCQIATIELSNGRKLLPIFAKSSISNVQQGPESASETF